jgi:hypothetical protein
MQIYNLLCEHLQILGSKGNLGANPPSKLKHNWISLLFSSADNFLKFQDSRNFSDLFFSVSLVLGTATYT